MDKIEAQELPENEKVYLKKDMFGWRIVLPAKNEDGTWNWFNLLGGKKGIYLGIFYIILALLFYFGVKELIGNYALIAKDPCQFCTDCQQMVIQAVNHFTTNSNIPQLNLSGVLK